MRSNSNDIDLNVEKLQIAILRENNVKKRLTLALSLSAAAINLSKRAIKRVNPGVSEKEAILLFVKYNYGNQYADRLGKYFSNLTYEKI